jgi:lipid-A-disaccharide synthase
MRIFISAGEPSGDLHGASLLRALRQRRPDVEVAGFGGERMVEAGCRLVYPLCDLAVIGLGPVLASLPTFVRVLGLARQTFRQQRPDAVVLIDYPGFNWWLARAAREFGIPVSYFVPPQIWAWATWRAGKMRRLVDQVLCCLPFEEPWYAQRRIAARYVGHPYFDELRVQRLDGAFLAGQRRRSSPIVGLLPGSRSSELRHNVPSLLRAAGLIHAPRPDVRFLVSCLKPQHADFVRGHLAGSRLPVEVHAGRTPEIIQLSHSCLAVSGSVGLELLYRGTPAVVVYQVPWHQAQVAPLFKRSKYISLVNLLADRLLFPEYFGHRCLAQTMAGHVLHWLHDRAVHEALCGQLAALRARVGQPGACDRAAEAILELGSGGRQAA